MGTDRSAVPRPDVPPAYDALVARLGPPLSVEEVRAGGRWGELVTAAEQGAATLITRERWEWTGLVPLTEVAEPLHTLDTWPLSVARDRLGEVVRAAFGYVADARWTGERPQILTRHRRPVAAIISARLLCERPAPADRISAEDLLRDRPCTLTVHYDPGESGAVDEDGIVTSEPIPDAFIAIIRDGDGNELVRGDAPDSIAEALLRLTTPPAYDAPPATSGPYTDEPPF